MYRCAVPIFFFCLIFGKIASLPNVFFLPGLAGNFLYANIDSEDSVPENCRGKATLPVNETFLLYTNVSLMLKHPQCFSELISLHYDNLTNSFSAPSGVLISTAHFGREAGIIPVYHSFFKKLESWGYEIGKTLFGIPYDFRYSTEKSLRQIGFIEEFQQLVERSFRRNGQKGFLIGHSNGGPTIYAFLQAMSKPWKEKYLSGIITLSGNLLGQMNAISAFFSSANPSPLETMATSWEATYTSTPWGDYEGLLNITDFIVTFNGNAENETHYSPKLVDIQALFQSVNRSDWSNIMSALYPAMDRSKAPEGVDVYCLYGSEVKTKYAYVFDQSITDNDPISILTMDGDGNQDSIDNEFCQVWKDSLINQEKKHFESQAFPGVHHMQMYSDDEVLNKVQDILQKY